jgi:hypothetical protein
LLLPLPLFDYSIPDLENQIQNRFAMRTLSENELTQIDDRLKEKKIMYRELFAKLKQHFVQALGEYPADRFPAALQSLDDKIQPSLLKAMEKELRAETSRKINQAQWEAIGFKSSNSWKAIILLLLFLAISFSLSATGILRFPDIPTEIGLASLFIVSGLFIAFAIYGRSNRNNLSLVSIEIFVRVVLIFAILAMLPLLFQSMLADIPDPIGKTLLLFFTLVYGVYSLSLFLVIRKLFFSNPSKELQP